MSLFYNGLTFSRWFGLEYVEIASPTDVIMSGLTAVGYYFAAAMAVTVAVMVTYIFAPDVVERPIRNLLAKRKDFNSVAYTLITVAVAFGLSTILLVNLLPKPHLKPADEIDFSRLRTNQLMIEAGGPDIPECENALVGWVGSDRLIIGCSDGIRVIANHDDLVLLRVWTWRHQQERGGPEGPPLSSSDLPD